VVCYWSGVWCDGPVSAVLRVYSLSVRVRVRVCVYSICVYALAGTGAANRELKMYTHPPKTQTYYYVCIYLKKRMRFQAGTSTPAYNKRAHTQSLQHTQYNRVIGRAVIQRTAIGNGKRCKRLSPPTHTAAHTNAPAQTDADSNSKQYVAVTQRAQLARM